MLLPDLRAAPVHRPGDGALGRENLANADYRPVMVQILDAQQRAVDALGAIAAQTPKILANSYESSAQRARSAAAVGLLSCIAPHRRSEAHGFAPDAHANRGYGRDTVHLADHRRMREATTRAATGRCI
jgi:hypothetical protein